MAGQKGCCIDAKYGLKKGKYESMDVKLTFVSKRNSLYRCRPFRIHTNVSSARFCIDAMHWIQNIAPNRFVSIQTISYWYKSQFCITTFRKYECKSHVFFCFFIHTLHRYKNPFGLSYPAGLHATLVQALNSFCSLPNKNMFSRCRHWNFLYILYWYVHC